MLGLALLPVTRLETLQSATVPAALLIEALTADWLSLLFGMQC